MKPIIKQTAGMQVIIMCKAPVAGQVKTRLISRRYSPEQAAVVHAAMATTVVHRATRLFVDVVVAADDVAHPFFAGFGVPVRAQGEGDLGVRMAVQVDYAFTSGAGSVLLLGTDSPHMKDERLLQAADALRNHDVVLGPVEDGGYDLAGVCRPLSIFTNVYWSSGLVLTQTLANIKRLDLSVIQLETGFDVDFPDDIERARQCGWQPESALDVTHPDSHN